MNKVVVQTLAIIVVLFFSSFSQATLITNLNQLEIDTGDYANAEDQLTTDLLGVNYISIGDFDWAWVSSLNLEQSAGNTLYAPEVQENWRFATVDDLLMLKVDTIVDQFTDNDGNLIQAMEFFNSDETLLAPSSVNDLKNNHVASEWTIPDSDPFGIWEIFRQYDTFYVRDSSAAPAPGAPKPIPEPLTIIIFATALIALQAVSRKKSA